MATNHASVSPETLITIKVTLNDAVKKLKLPIKDLNSTVLPDKVSHDIATLGFLANNFLASILSEHLQRRHSHL